MTLPDHANVRRRAEEALKTRETDRSGPLLPDEALALVHELQVHQIELELQNEELVQARHEAEALRDQYIDLYDFAPVGYLTIDRKGTILALNLTGSVLLSASRQALVGSRLQLFMHPGCIGAFGAFCDRVLLSGTTETFEAEMTGAAGRRPWYAQVKGMADPACPADRIRLVLSDITERKEGELRLARSAELLRRSNEELQRFAYVASHDLQEPLRSIVSFAQLLDRRYRGRLDQDADEYLGYIVEGGNRMQMLIRDLLQVSRVETGARPLEPTDAAGVVAGALRLLGAPLREAGGAVTIGPMPRVMADAAQLEQVFTNLLGNAIKYRRPGVPPAITVSAERQGDWWAFAVADNGIGIEAEYFDRIFEMFRRLHTHEVYEGTGIGLAVVKRIVERHGGTVRVESTPGEGSTFLFTLPDESFNNGGGGGGNVPGYPFDRTVNVREPEPNPDASRRAAGPTGSGGGG